MDPITIGSHTPVWLEYLQGFGPFFAVGLTALFTWKIALRRIKSEFDLKREETRLFKERVFIENKIGLLNDIEAIQDKYTTNLSDNIESISAKFLSIRDRIESYVITDDLISIAQRGVDEAAKLDTLIKKIIKTAKDKKINVKSQVDSLIEENKSKLAKPASALRISLLLLHQHLSFDLGFRPITVDNDSKDIDILAADLIKRTLDIENDS